MNGKVKKRVAEKVVLKQEQLEEKEKLERKEKKRRIMILSLAIISIAGFALSLLFLVGITGAVIGPSRGNLWGLIFIVISLLIWAVAEMLWIKGKGRKEVNIKTLLETAEREIQPPPMLYRKTI